LPEVLSFSEDFIAAGATDNVRKSINVALNMIKVFAGKVRKTGFFLKSGFSG
jgi:hypothetical protein